MLMVGAADHQSVKSMMFPKNKYLKKSIYIFHLIDFNPKLTTETPILCKSPETESMHIPFYIRP